ncbi:MAG: malate synthase G, partial [Aestuariivirga sp.]
MKIDEQLKRFVAEEALPGTGISEAQFWDSFSKIVHDLAPRNRALLKTRDELQVKIDAWNKAHQQKFDAAEYRAFLKSIGYLVDEGPDFSVSTQNVDAEIATLAGPQLVVPVNNARFALNAANARWGSLYDALYGTDALGHPSGKGFDPVHGAKVVAWVREFLDVAAPLSKGTWATLEAFAPNVLKSPAQYMGKGVGRDSILLVNNGIHIEIVFDRTTEIGKSDKLGISDVVIESALTTIMDCEDSVAAVDAEDKVLVYRNWLGLMNGKLAEDITKGGKTFTRK